jgi:vancomycin resistance protein YoaR
MRSRIVTLGIASCLVAGIGIWAAIAPGTEHQIGSYVTTLNGRTDSQIFNARLAVHKINGTVIQPGKTFSFVKAVGPWTADVGYKKAPVSYDGELIDSWGGGVCQVSTTVYNAALIAGLEIAERHHHHWPARYAPLGRDAAVAYENIDLKFRNTLPAPVRIVGKIDGENLIFSLYSTATPSYSVRIESEMRSVTLPNDIVQDRTSTGRGRWKLVNRGHPGFYVATYRRFLARGENRRQLISTDQYPVMNRVVRITER